MEDFKSILASKTVWGAIIAIGAGIAGIFGYSIGAEDQANLVEIGFAAASTVGGVIAIFGRVKASKKIGKAE